jgi:hypothetical protein
MREAIRRIADRARDDDIVVVFVSTHGSRKVLSVNAAQLEYDGLTAAQLSDAIAPLGDRPTVVILSACFSGSFVPELHRDSRIVLTAASADKSSYGCNATGRNTFFVEELFKNNFDPDESLVQLMARAKSQTTRRESLLNVVHSEPQIFAGPKSLWLMDRPLTRWFAPGTALVGPIARLDDGGKLDYARYLNRPYPSAFVIGANGHWSSAWSRAVDVAPEDPASRALDTCKRHGGTDCRLYSIDGRVVQPSEAPQREYRVDVAPN